MFIIDKNTKTIHITRGDHATVEVTAQNEDGSNYVFKKDDIIRFKVFTAKNFGEVHIQKDVKVESDTEIVPVVLDKEATRIGEAINKKVDYWYEVEVNPDTYPQTIIGYDRDGEKLFVVYPEGGTKE